MIWFSALDRGNHGMADSFKYRKMITEFIWEGKSPSQSREEDRVASARSAIGAPAPEDALEQARRLRARLGNKVERPQQETPAPAKKSDPTLDAARALHKRLKKTDQ